MRKVTAEKYNKSSNTNKHHVREVTAVNCNKSSNTNKHHVREATAGKCNKSLIKVLIQTNIT